MAQQTRQTTQLGVLGELTRLSAALEVNAGELAHLEGTRLRFAALVHEAENTARHQIALAAEKQEESRRLERLLIEGKRLATGLSRLLREYYGIGSEKLVEFGLQPFRGRSRRTPLPPPEVEAVETPAPDNSKV